jgi:hypothetical protein
MTPDSGVAYYYIKLRMFGCVGHVGRGPEGALGNRGKWTISFLIMIVLCTT